MKRWGLLWGLLMLIPALLPSNGTEAALPETTPTPSPGESPLPPVITPDNAAQVVELQALEGHTGAVYTVAWSPDGSRLATGCGGYEGQGGDTHVRIWGIPPAS
jgi:WD40 repeat protein